MMKSKGLVKLMEECGELTQVCAKRAAYPRGKHPDEYREKPLNERIEEEMGDVLGAIQFVTKKLGLDRTRIIMRGAKKFARFKGWDKDTRRGRRHPIGRRPKRKTPGA